MLNPNHNLFSVAPVGNSIIIARAAALKGGMERPRVMNLIAWLIISTGATPKEIGEIIREANGGEKVTQKIPVPVVVAPVPGPATVLPVPPPNAPASPPVNEGTAAQVKPFIGQVDAEEGAAIAAAVEAAGKQLEDATRMDGKPVDADAIERAWTAQG